MKKSFFLLANPFIITLVSLFIITSGFAQAPEAFTYQAIVRDNSGQPLPDVAVSFQFNILQGSASGTVVYSEDQSATTNGFGLVNLKIGQGTVNSGTFSTIDWGNDVYFLNIQIDQGSGFVDMGTQQFISVPYALYAKTAGNGGTTYTAGNGISITGNIISNTAPDQTVTITGNGATTVSGTYPNFTISSTDNVDDADADATNEIQTLSDVLTYGNNAGSNGVDMNNQDITNAHIIGLGSSNANYLDMYWGNIRDYNNSHGINGQVLTVHGTSPNTYVTWDTPNIDDADADSTNEIQTLSVTGNQLSISGSGGNTVTMQTAAAGNTGDVQLNDNGSIGADPDLHWDFAGKKFIVGQDTSDGRMIIQQDANAPDSIPILEVKNKLGQTIFVVYPDSVHIFIGDDNAKGVLKGGFAVSGRSGTKSITNDYLLVRPDSTRIWTQDSIAGFGIRNLGSNGETSYMQLTPENYFIGENSGVNISTGLFNSTFGFEAGKNMTFGNRNILLGYRSGVNIYNGYDNIFIGDSAGFNNSSYSNIFIGNNAGQENLAYENIYIGYHCAKNGSTGQYNTYVGTNIGENSTGSLNTFFGRCAPNNTSGSYNVFMGTNAGFQNTTGSNNVFIGEGTGGFNTTGNYNTFIGQNAGGISDTLENATCLGYNASATQDNSVVIGNTSVTSIGGYAAWSNLSDKRFKTDVKENVPGLDFILKLKPVTYHLDIVKLNNFLGVKENPQDELSIRKKQNEVQTGFLAQDVEKTANELGFKFSGIDKPDDINKDHYSLRYSEFVVPLVKAIQEQQQIIENQNKKIDELVKRIEKLEKQK